MWHIRRKIIPKIVDTSFCLRAAHSLCSDQNIIKRQAKTKNVLNNGAVKSCDEREQKKEDRQKLKEKSEHKEAKKKIVKSVAISEKERERNQGIHTL